MSFDDDIGELGFELLDERRGARRFTRRSNPFLKWWLMIHPDGTAELTWEFELGEYLKAKGLHVSVQDELSLLLFPSQEARGPADGAWLRAEIERSELQLKSVDLLTGS